MNSMVTLFIKDTDELVFTNFAEDNWALTSRTSFNQDIHLPDGWTPDDFITALQNADRRERGRS